MTPIAVMDTHAVVWYLNAGPRLSDRVRHFLAASVRDGLRILVSSISFVEIIYLYEKGRLSRDALDRLETALRSGNTVLHVADLTMDIVRFLSRVPRDEVPDMPDRIIAATAL